jgi:hypothetical protein
VRGGNSAPLNSVECGVNTLCQVSHNFVLPHASLRQRLLVPEPTHGRGSAKMWRPWTPAMAADLTDHVWSLKRIFPPHFGGAL